MGFMDAIKRQLRPSPDLSELRDVTSNAQQTGEWKSTDVDLEAIKQGQRQPVASGVARVEAVQAVWGKHGKWIIVAGLAMMLIVYELDNTTVYIYQQYATSSYNEISLLGTLSTAGVIVFAVVKPPIAKLSNIIGRGETYIFTISCYLMSYILCATSKSINGYAAGYIFYCVGQSGTNIMNDIIISDITTARWRGLAIGASFFPFLVIPWISAFITESVVKGIGWRWGIGMLGFIMPFCASFIITTLLYFQGKAKKAGIVLTQKVTVYDFCSQMDFGGTILFCGGFAMLLLPLTLASTTTSSWRTPWIDAVLAMGCVFLLALPVYEHFIAKHPLIPTHYFKNFAIVCSILLIALDSMGFSVTHTYLYAWFITTHNFSIRVATFYIYVNGVTQCLVGIIAGYIMLKTRRYKWLVFTGVCVRIIGYGLMVRLREANSSLGELFAVQLIQGTGSGLIQTSVFVGAQINVPHSQLAQITALVVCFSFLGSSIGASIAGGIYTVTFKEQLRSFLGGNATPGLIDQLFGSISGVLPVWGSADRVAINDAYSNVMRFEVYAAIAASVPSFVFAWFMPNLELPEKNNLVEA